MGLNSRLGLEYLRTVIREHAESLILAVALALVVRWLILAAYVVRSDNMEPTLVKGDIVLGFKLPYGLFSSPTRMPQRGDLVIFQCPRDPGMCLLRVVGMAGDRVVMGRQRLVVNGEPCTYGPDKSQILSETCSGHRHAIGISASWSEESWGPVVCPPDQFFVLNDFRPDGADSRAWGCVNKERLVGRVLGIWISLDWSASNRIPRVRWERSFLSLN